ncbi:hypothetical protein Dimus_034726 [Dionaea muscipula]
MGGNSMDQNQHQHPNDAVEKIFKLDRHRLETLKQKLATPPRLLSTTAGRSTCSIFKIPQSFVDVNGRFYHPHIVSIGPFHRGRPHLEMFEEHKYHYLSQLLSRTQLPLENLFMSLHPLELPARESYSEAIHLDSHDFVEMMVVDGCFIIELFRKVSKLARFQPDDPIASMSWILSFLLRDFVRLENQLPFFVLERLYEVTRLYGDTGGPTLARLSLNCFEYAFDKLEDVAGHLQDLQGGKHLLDLLRTALIPPELETRQRGLGRTNTPSHVIHSVSKLRRAGIQLRQGKSPSILMVKFHRGVLEMPTVTIDDFLTTFLANCVVYELCHKNSSTYFTTYATLLDCLVNSSVDVEYLEDRNILENYFGTAGEIARFINNLGKDMSFDIERCYLAKMFNEVNQYSQNSWHVQWAGFKYTYFNSPWSFISALAAFILMVISLMQTLYTVLPYYVPSSSSS